MAKTETVEFCGEVRPTASTKAVLVHDGINEVWLPKSQIISERRVGSSGDDFVFVIPHWLAKRKGII